MATPSSPSETEPDQKGTPFGRSAPDPDRFTVSRHTLRIDRFMNRFIVVGGVSVILAVFGICFFIVAEVVPLFQSASVRELQTIETGVASPLAIGSDEWTELPFVLGADGSIAWVHLGAKAIERAQLPLGEDFAIASVAYHQGTQELLLGSRDGRIELLTIGYRPVFAPDGTRTIQAQIKAGRAETVGTGVIEKVAFKTADAMRTVGVIETVGPEGEHRLHLLTYKRKRTLFGSGNFVAAGTYELADQLPGAPVGILLGSGGETAVVQCEDGRLVYFRHAGETWERRQEFRPFAEGETISSLDFLQGEVSLNLTSDRGENIIYSLTPTEDGLLFRQTKTLPPLAAGATHFSASVRNKAYLLSDDREVSLRYATTEKVRWHQAVEAPLADVLLGEKYDRVLLLEQDGTLHVSLLDDPHPEAGLRAFFGKIWYEGQDQPRYTWQSTGGSDDFEPKLSLVPLIVGSLKGTFYALLFAVPIALMSAIYTSQFLRPGLKRIIKPTMEIMASLPSVVLGFLGALWLAPILETRVPSFLLLFLFILGSAVIVGQIWNRMPINVRVYVPRGTEFIVFFPILMLAGWLGWQAGPALESLLFTVADPETGGRIADFRLWWAQISGETFQQRNSLVVGIAMGFAVIPLIFTISEDALSNVPQSLVSGSLALGASRWQTTARVVLPGASAGIFSALMIGLGRAVGETMIVVMATGNTPIMDMDIFSGMRTLSANIAVELPEAPHGGTLYRALFLGAFVLFVLTFAVNTLAEALRHRLRERYKVIG